MIKPKILIAMIMDEYNYFILSFFVVHLKYNYNYELPIEIIYQCY